jgi:Ca2+-binding RTX toxin-like protein
MAEVSGTRRDDRLIGTELNDVIRGLAGADRLLGRGSYDSLMGGFGNDVLLGGAGDDGLYGDRGSDRLVGGYGRDALYGGSGDDLLEGGGGSDQLSGGTGADRFNGGAGDDFVIFREPISFGHGAEPDRLPVTQGVIVDLAMGKISNDGYGNAETCTSIEGVEGTVYTDVLLGSAAANTLQGGRGDTVHGLGGADIIVMQSLAGATFSGGTGFDILTLAGYEGQIGADGQVKTVWSDQNMIVDLRIDQVLNDGFGNSSRLFGFEGAATGGLNDTLFGDDQANQLAGSGGNDVIDGGSGADTLIGGSGNDVLTGGAGADVFIWGNEYLFTSVFGEVDVIIDFSAGDRLNVQPAGYPMTFIGTREFGSEAFAIRYEVRGADTFMEIQVRSPVDQIGVTVKLLGRHELTIDNFIAVRDGSSTIPFEGADMFSPLTVDSNFGALCDIP